MPTPQSDALTPPEIAAKVETLGVAKAHLPTFPLFVLAVLAGAFISLGALFFTVVMAGTDLGFGLTRFIGGLSFCLGLILVVVAGAELFTGNNLLAMAWASRLISTREILRNWFWVYLGNVAGCLGTVALVMWANTDELGQGVVGPTAVAIAASKAGLPFWEAFARGILCNALVCLAVWLAMGGRSVSDKILAILFPVTAFVVLGFEHSIANWFFLPYGYLLNPESIEVAGALQNLLAVTLGNLVGGSLLVAGVYWSAYLKPKRR
ncbi:MAG: formate/nitrite transporter family protein [Planctomycetota bacterium]|nr:formate/nitrite transporter family protein [Planctomycetota bacterium]MDA1113860.1 formate/nitrite transporter family protein [Planctomycetota bacterium]